MAKATGAKTGTTARREWLGWFGCVSWLFFMMYGYDNFMPGNSGYADASSWPTVFMLVFALAIAAFGWKFGRDPEGLSKIAFYSTPAAILFTAAFPLTPAPFGSVLYTLAPVFMAPALVRRVYGVLCTAGPECRITRYMAGVAACVAAFTVWMMAGPPTEIAFLVPALLAVPAWLGVRRAVVLPDEPPKTRALRPSKGYIVLFAATVAALLAFDLLNGAIHTNIVLTGMEESAPLMVLGFTLPLVGFVAYGLLHDKGHERLGFICGMGLCLIGVIAALIPSGTAEGRLWVLAFTDGLGGTYTEFFILTIPVFFFTGAKRPLFAASLGVIVNLVASAYRWAGEAWLPERLLAPDAPLYAATAITAVVFVALAHFIFERRREKSLAAALHALVYGGADEPPGMEGAGLTPEEREVALLLIAGKTRSDILRKLRIPAAQVSQREDAIRQKLKLPRSPDPAIAAAASAYQLTKRETDVLAYLRQGMGNGEIAAELSLSEETVKGHVRNLMRKLPVESRGGVGAWLESWAQDGENP